MNRQNNCQNHLTKIKEKIKKVHKMIFLAGKNELDKWKRLYIFMQYLMSLLYYGSHQIFVTKNTLEGMMRSVDFYSYKALIVKQLKSALSLPKKGKVEPMMEMFFKFDPEHIIIPNYLQQIEKYVHS